MSLRDLLESKIVKIGFGGLTEQLKPLDCLGSAFLNFILHLVVSRPQFVLERFLLIQHNLLHADRVGQVFLGNQVLRGYDVCMNLIVESHQL